MSNGTFTFLLFLTRFPLGMNHEVGKAGYGVPQEGTHVAEADEGAFLGIGYNATAEAQEAHDAVHPSPPVPIPTRREETEAEEGMHLTIAPVSDAPPHGLPHLGNEVPSHVAKPTEGAQDDDRPHAPDDKSDAHEPPKGETLAGVDVMLLEQVRSRFFGVAKQSVTHMPTI